MVLLVSGSNDFYRMYYYSRFTVLIPFTGYNNYGFLYRTAANANRYLKLYCISACYLVCRQTADFVLSDDVMHFDFCFAAVRWLSSLRRIASRG